MIVSHRYRFIFLKTRKTAGTSIEIALSRFCGPDDIITPIWKEDEGTRRQLGYRGPQNYLAPIGDYTLADWKNWLVKRRRKLRFYNHMPASEIRFHVGQPVWDSYYKFCFERNPWDRVISQYFWRGRLRPGQTMTGFLATDGPALLRRSGYEMYTIDNRVAVDRICRYENLAEELETVRTRLGIPEPLALPWAKAQFRTDKRSYNEILNASEKAKIAALFREEIDLLGYEV